jgi:hypothetical protein
MSHLTPELADYLDAPFPYIVGLQLKDWEHINQRRSSMSSMKMFQPEDECDEIV